MGNETDLHDAAFQASDGLSAGAVVINGINMWGTEVLTSSLLVGNVKHARAPRSAQVGGRVS